MRLILLTVAQFVGAHHAAHASIARWRDLGPSPRLFGGSLGPLAAGFVAIKISGIDRIRRDLLVGAWLGQALRKTGFYGAHVARVLRFFGHETALKGPDSARLVKRGLSWSRLNDAALIPGWSGAVIGMTMIWATL